MNSIKLSTEVSVPASPWKINYDTQLMTLGSCFATLIGDRLFESKFRVLPNELGTLFNPWSISKLLQFAIREQFPHLGHYLSLGKHHHVSYDFHSSVYSDTTLDDFDTQLRLLLRRTRQQLLDTDVLVLTFGSAFAYRYLKTGELIANCHKTPAGEFQKELLSLETLSQSMDELLALLLPLNPDLKIIVTVSPVRHTRDTLPLNQVSKSLLRLLCHYLETTYPQVAYFPSYEIMLDELRDYRFYEPDLIHPDSVAVDHIFRTFLKAYLDQETHETLKEWQQAAQAIAHTPKHGYSEEYRKHLTQTIERLRKLKNRLAVETEIEKISLILKNQYP